MEDAEDGEESEGEEVRKEENGDDTEEESDEEVQEGEYLFTLLSSPSVGLT